jgi:hypothetical protein
MARELVWAGFDMVAREHSGDYGVEGARPTARHVAKAGLAQAGLAALAPAIARDLRVGSELRRGDQHLPPRTVSAGVTFDF